MEVKIKGPGVEERGRSQDDEEKEQGEQALRVEVTEPRVLGAVSCSDPLPRGGIGFSGSCLAPAKLELDSRLGTQNEVQRRV